MYRCRPQAQAEGQAEGQASQKNSGTLPLLRLSENSRSWRPVFDDEHASVIIVEFRPSGPDATEVVLTYTHLDRHGELARVIRSAVANSSPDDTLHRYAGAVTRYAAAARGATQA